MKKIFFPLALLLIILASSFTASLIWNVSANGVTINFELPDQGTKGTVSGLKASIDFDAKDPVSSKITASIDIKTLNTGDAKKDHHLLTADFFDAEKFPLITFTSSSIKASNEGFLATGNLTMKDSTKNIEIPFTFSEDASGAGVFKGTMTVFSGDFGITKKSGSGKDKVIIQINVPVKK
jgi:polyisoprenoid-binding protein YceI